MLQIRQAGQAAEKHNLETLIYGFPGVGKTSLSYTAAGPLLLDFDDGMGRAEGSTPSHLLVKTWAEILELTESNLADHGQFKTLIIDTVGVALDDYCAFHCINSDPKLRTKTGGLTQSGYGALKSTFKHFHDWAKRQNVNIVYLAHLEEKGGDEAAANLRPKISGGTKDLLFAKADLIGYMKMEGGQRTLNFTPHENAIAKDAGRIGNVILPEVDSQEWGGFLQGIFDKALDKINTKAREQAENQLAVIEWRDVIQETGDVASLNQYIAEIKKLDAIEGIRLQLRKLISVQAKKMGWKFDNANKCYIEEAPAPAQEPDIFSDQEGAVQ